MLLLRICFLLTLLPFLAAYPVQSQANAGQNAAEFPDLTNGLSDAEVESTLNGLSLDDLNTLNKLLDDAGNGPFDFEASLRGHHRQAAKKPQHYEEMESADEELEPALNSNKQSYEDTCHDEEEAECTEQPKCKKRPSTKRCSTTRRCATTACKSMDGFLDIHVDTNKYGSKHKYEEAEECDPEDTMCLQRNQQRYKQRPSMNDFSEIAVDQVPAGMESLEQLADEAHRDESLKLSKLDNWNGKNDAAPDVFNREYSKLSNDNANSWAEERGMAEYEAQPQQNNVEERRQLSRREEQAEELERSALDEDMQQNAAQAAADDFESQPLANDMMAANEGDSFIANNAREPVRYVIKTSDGSIRSEYESGEQLLRSDKQQSEMLNYDNPNQNQLDSKRIKRDSKKTDDEPEIVDESYIKKLMDSFPRDQGSQSNIAIRQAKRSHLRVKRKLSFS